jgi:hypothetical protein
MKRAKTRRLRRAIERALLARDRAEIAAADRLLAVIERPSRRNAARPRRRRKAHAR